MSRRERTQLVFTLALAALGWAAVLGAALVGRTDLPPHGATGVAMFAAVILATRAMAFPIGPGAVLSLDSGFYVAAAVTLGPAVAGLLVAVALTADAAVRWWRRSRAAGLDERRGLAYVAYFGGVTGALVAGAAWLVGHAARGAGAGEVAMVGRVIAIGLVLLLVHNLVQGARLALGGRRPASFVREQAAPGIVAELALLPVAAVAAQLFVDDRLLGFTLLAATHLVLNFAFNRLARASAAGRARVRELELLDGSARALGASIELGHVVATVARETAAALPSADAILLVHRGAARETDRLVVDRYERAGERHASAVVPRGAGPIGQVLATRAPVRRDDGVGEDGARAEARSWLGVPVMLHGACEGALVVESRRAGAFTDADERLLGSLALQVGAALANAHLHAMAMVDGLTGLFVRRYFDARLDEEVERARRYRTPFAVAMIDLDDFKRCNDLHGHLVGDRVLREIASVVRAEIRGVDTAARYGGEELALILPGTDLPSAFRHAERVRRAIAARRVTAGDGGSRLPITASIGLAAFPDSGATTAEELLRRADDALYRAKRAGKNRVEPSWAEPSGERAAPPPAPWAERRPAPPTVDDRLS